MAPVAAEARVNTSIFMTHFGCIVNCGYVRQVVDDLREQLGVPTAVIDIDAMNPLVFSWAQIKNNLDEYFAMLEQQNAGKPSIWAREETAEAPKGEPEGEFSSVSLR